MTCGCLRREVAPKHGDVKALSQDGTNLAILASKKPRSNNHSGVRGVSWVKSKQRWQAQLMIKGVAHTAFCDTLEEAAEKRKEMEEQYLKPLLESK